MTPSPTSSPSTQTTPNEKRDSAGNVLREGITAVISLAIAAVALYMLLSIYVSGGRPFPAGQEKVSEEAYGRQKDLLLYALALLGTVTGYYLGRVPAELHAQKADREARAAQKEAQAATKSEEDTKTKARKSIKRIKAIAEGTNSGVISAGITAASPSSSPHRALAARGISQSRLRTALATRILGVLQPSPGLRRCVVAPLCAALFQLPPAISTGVTTTTGC